jgi:hypothetical protein
MVKKVTSMEELEAFFNTVPDEATYMEVYVEHPNLPEAEVIRNPISNMIKKIEYYKSAYNDNLTLKTCDKIRIIAVDYCFSMLKKI